MDPFLSRGGARLAGWAGGELLLAEGDAFPVEGEALAGDLLLVGAADDLKETGGDLVLGHGTREERPGQHAGVVDRGGGEAGDGPGGERLGGLDLDIVVLRQDVAPVVLSDRALADDDAELLAEKLDDFLIGVIFVVEPVAEQRVLLGRKLHQPGIAADFLAGAQRRTHRRTQRGP